MTTESTQALARIDPTSLPLATQVFGAQRLQVLRDVIAKGCTDAEIETFAAICQRTRKDPFAKQIYAIKRWDGKAQREILTIVQGVDGYRLDAQRSHQYAGQIGPQWCGPDGVWRDVWLSKDPPAAARVGVLRKGFAEPLWSVAVWDRAKVEQNVYEGQGQNRHKVGVELAPFWKKAGAEMLAKTAEVNAIKRAFPQETSDVELATDEELAAEQARIDEMAAKYDRIFGDDDGNIPPQVQANIRTPNGNIVDGSTGEIIGEAEDPWIARRARLATLLGEARARGLRGEPPLAASPGDDPLEQAIEYWEQRIANFDQDQQAHAASQATFDAALH